MTEPTHTPQPGKVIFVGAGPGNPELLTVRAREVMESNSIALVDPEVSAGVRSVVAAALPVPKAKMDAANERYEKMCAEAKEAGARRKPPRPEDPTAAELQEVGLDGGVIVEKLKLALNDAAEAVERGEAGDGDVIRLVCGNPLTRDSVMEEISAVAAEGMEFQVVPGMSLPSTVPSFAGIALGSTYTEADLNNGGVDWDQLASAPQPLVFQANQKHLADMVEQLTQRGFQASTPVTVTTRGTTRLQRTFDATLGTVGKLDAELEGPLVVTLGTAADDRSKYSWWENRPLYGWRVLVPRTKEQSGSKVHFFDGRNAREAEIGRFRGAVVPDVETTHDFIKELDSGKYDWMKDKPVISYCTGGIRCEVLSSLMINRGFKEVYQIDGGIVRYGEKFGNSGLWEGSLYVFDDRMHTEFGAPGDPDYVQLGHCVHCGAATNQFYNCANEPECRRQYLSCEDCRENNPYCGECAQRATA